METSVTIQDTQSSLLARKLKRFAIRQQPHVLDLFAGAGGMSLGLKSSGCTIIGGIEVDPVASASHCYNFHGDKEALRSGNSIAYDITRTDPLDYVQSLYPDQKPEEMIDIIIGGPPCQAFARIGRAKLREVTSHPEAYKRDERSLLYKSYLRYIKHLKPVALIMENVLDILNYGGQNIAEEICETLDEMGYECRYSILNAAFYGVPQMRERFFLIGIAKECNLIPAFPEPSNWVNLPSGYEGARRVALKTLITGAQTSLFTSNYFVEPQQPKSSLPRAISVREAIEDLPSITLHLEGKLRRGAKRFNELLPYRKDFQLSSYAQQMRTWTGYEGEEGVYDHVIRYLPRDYAIFKRMNPGDQYPEAYKHALDLFNEKIEYMKQNGQHIIQGSKEYDSLFIQIVPPYDDGKFPNKWRKLEADVPSRTLLAHLGKDGYSHIHYDDNQARTISVREAARLQSFPDGFRFAGTMNPAMRQIGNAVPPLLAKAIADHLLRLFRNTVSHHKDEY